MSREAFLNAIACHPADDAPRLIFADWLQENDDEDRAELLRQQVALALRKPWETGYTTAELACHELLARHPEWYAGLAAYMPQALELFHQQPLEFHRGFINHVSLTPEFFWKNRDTLLQELLVRKITLDGREGLLGSRRDYQKCKRLRALHLTRVSTPPDWKKATRWLDHLPHLEHWGLLNCIPAEFAEGIFQHPHVLQVQSLSLLGTYLPEVVERKLIDADLPNIRSLRRTLTLQGDWLVAPWAKRLSDLSLSDPGRYRSERATPNLIDFLPRSTLRSLRLHNWELDDAQADRWAMAINESQLESLTLSSSETPSSVHQRWLGRVERPLQALALTGLSDQHSLLHVIAYSASAPSLRVLAMDRVNSDGFAFLAHCERFRAIESLRLGIAPRGFNPDQSLPTLLTNPAWGNLRSLSLTFLPRFGDERLANVHNSQRIVQALAQLDTPPSLEELRLDLPSMHRLPLALWRSFTTWPHLKRLVVRMPHDEASFAALKVILAHRFKHYEHATYV